MTKDLDFEPAGPPAAGVAERPERARLRGSLGVWGIVFIVVAAAAPLGVMGGTVPIGLGFGNGAGFPAAFAAGAIILLLFAAGFTALTPYVRNAGAFYSYIGAGLGRKTGFGAAFVALLAYTAEVIAVYGLLGGGADNLFSSWGLDVHWAFWAILACLGVAYLGHRNIDLSKRVLGVLLIAEVVIIVALDTAVFVTGGDSGLSTGFLEPSTVLSGAPGLALLFAFLGFLGFEATAVFRDEARDPDRTIPRATYTAVIVIGVFYVISTWALISAWGDQAALEVASTAPDSMLPLATERYLGTMAFHLVQALYVSSLFACVLSFHNIVTRYTFTLSNRGALPALFGKPHAKHGSPHTASAMLTVVAIVFIIGAALVGLDPANQLYAWFAGTTTVAFILLLLGTSTAVLVFFNRQRKAGQLTHSVGRAFVAPGLAVLGLVGVTILVLQNLPGLVGDSKPIAIGILCLLGAAFVGGWVLAAKRPISLE
ncbi:APC family permease [Georgenia yuyongxinii]|uniref:APC family permease n=1 Tax=Georgenia yuyongxinii TaxID=2589797 RepID=A0A5B8C5J4_9MICO|nr:APC family permease [Georgenia yuyongxinii]QDC25628.1 APC family permease [Georgenia yuyongxinii]